MKTCKHHEMESVQWSSRSMLMLIIIIGEKMIVCNYSYLVYEEQLLLFPFNNDRNREYT